MLTAGDGENHGGIPFYRLFQGVIRSRVAGVKRHNHVHMVHAVVGSNIAVIKLQLVEAIGHA